MTIPSREIKSASPPAWISNKSKRTEAAAQLLNQNPTTMNSVRSILQTTAWLLLLVAPGLALSQAEIEIRKAKPAVQPEATPLVEMVQEQPAPALKASPIQRPPAPRAAPTPLPTSSGSADNYRMRTNDVLSLNVFGHPDLSGALTVREDGTVRLPLINELVKVGGSTLGEVETRVRLLLGKDYIRDPRVQLNIYQYATVKIYVGGRVMRAGEFTQAANKPITLAQAIVKAGGKTNLGNLRKVYLKRGGRVTTHDVESMMRNPDTDRIILQDGDIIDVPESGIFN
jgi:polysaccharide export outer membrane protein